MSTPDPEGAKNGRSPLVKTAAVGAMGFEFVGVVVGSFIVGGMIDEKFGVGPWGTVGSLAAGMIAAGWHVYLIAKRFLLENESKDGDG